MRKVFLLICVVLFANQFTKAQSLTVNEEPNITRLMALYVAGGKATTTPSTSPNSVQIIDGFRIQLMATTDRLKVDEAQSVFSSRYPGIYTGWSQAKPYYRVRVGGFSSRTDATNFLQKIKRDYPDAYIVPDKVKTNEITN